jgi:hypothetical protein
MAKSIKQLQDEVLGYLDRIGEDKNFFERATKLNSLEYYLTISAANFILKVQENLETQGKVDTGGLGNKLQQTAVIQNANELSITIGYPADSPEAKYYDYVNKGVRGSDSSKNQNTTSPYTYKKTNPNKAMVFSIGKWLRRNASIGRREDKRALLTKTQKKGASLSKMVDESKRFKSLAFAVAKSIKQKGLKKSGYFDDAIQYSFGKDFTNTVSRIIGQEIVLNIKAIQPDGNNNQ